MLRKSHGIGWVVALVAALAVVPGAPGFGRPPIDRAPSPVRSQADAVPGELIVRYDPGTTSAEKRQIRADQGATLDETLALPRTEVVELPTGTSVEAAAAVFEDDPDVAFAEPNYIRHVTVIPDDTMWASLGGMQKIAAPSAWDTGIRGTTAFPIAVIDSGVEYTHPDLAGNIWTNTADPPGGGDQDGNGLVDDTHGWDFVQGDNAPLDANEHGTHVAGTIGAVGNNARGVAGVNWTAAIMPLRAGDASGSLQNSAIVSAMQYACAKGARVVNESFGGSFSSIAEQTVLGSAACENTLFVVAAGNDSLNNDLPGNAQFPCNYTNSNLICVAATDNFDTIAGFSNYGTTSVDLAAPGVGIQSTVPTFDTVWSDGFENTPTAFSTRWTSTGAPKIWSQVTPGIGGSSFEISDSSGNYGFTTDTSLRTLNGTDLTGRHDCSFDYSMRINTADDNDFFTLEAATSLGGPYTDVSQGGWSGETGSRYFQLTEDLRSRDGLSATFLRFRFRSDNDGNADGVHIDDTKLKCLGTPTAPNGDYLGFNGTSMASPHVAGAAALVLANHPGYTTAQLRASILNGVEVLPELSTRVATSGRLDVRKAIDFVPASPPPSPTLSSLPASLVASTTATFGFTDSDGSATFQCRIDGAVFTTCVSPATFSSLDQGGHVFDVRAVSAGGPSAPVSASWRVDTFPPTTPSLVRTAFGTTGIPIAWTAASDLNGPINYDVFVRSTKVATTTKTSRTVSVPCGRLSTVGVEAIDAAGNRSPRGSLVVTGHSCLPQTTISSGPSATTTSRSATFRFRSSKARSTFQCKLDGRSWRTCRSPKTYKTLKKGRHTVRVRAISPGGLKDTTPALRTWRIR